MNYKTKLQNALSELKSNYNSEFYNNFNFFSSEYKGWSKKQVVSNTIFHCEHSVECLSKGIEKCKEAILESDKIIKQCGNIKKYKAAKVSEKKHIKLYENCIKNKENAILMYKKLIAICKAV